MALFEKNKNAKKQPSAHAKKYYLKDTKIEGQIEGKLVNIDTEKGLLNEQLVINEKGIVGILDKAGQFVKSPSEIEGFKNKHKGLTLCDIDGNDIGTLNQNGEPKFEEKIDFSNEKIVLDKNNKLSGVVIKENGKEQWVDRNGDSISPPPISDKKEILIKETSIQKGIENLQKQPEKSSLKSGRDTAIEQAKAIGSKLTKDQLKERKERDGNWKASQIKKNKESQITRL